MSWRDYAWRFTLSKTTARSYLEQIDPATRELAGQCAEAFIKARDKEDPRPALTPSHLETQ